MDENKPKAKWLDKYDIADPEHVSDLETQSAIHEFNHKLPRHEAEKKAYDDYIQERTEESAAHHLAGMRAAQGAGDMDAARQHGALYQMALKQLGHPEVGEVPTSITNRLKHQPPKLYRFKGHDSDSFLAGGKEDRKDNEPTMAKSVAKVIVEKLLKAAGPVPPSKPAGVSIGNTQSGKPIMSPSTMPKDAMQHRAAAVGHVGTFKNFTSQDHHDAYMAHIKASRNPNLSKPSQMFHQKLASAHYEQHQSKIGDI